LQVFSDSARLREARVKEHLRSATNAAWTLVAVLSLALLGLLRFKGGVACCGDRGNKQQEARFVEGQVKMD